MVPNSEISSRWELCPSRREKKKNRGYATL
jgi:hypothetical protein